MKTDTPGGRGSLVVELATGTAIVNGTRIEMPRREFDLLAALAARPGETFSSQELVQEVWPDDPVATDQDLRTLLYRLRKRIGDHDRSQRIVANRPAFGYLIDLSPDAVEVVKLASVLEDADTRVIVLDDQDASETEAQIPTPDHIDQTVDEDTSSETQIVRSTQSPRRAGIRVTPVVIAALVTAGLLAGSWQLGYFLSQRRGVAPQTIDRPSAEEHEDSANTTRPSKPDRRGSKSSSKHQTPRRSSERSSQGGLSVGDSTSSGTTDQESSGSTRQSTDKSEELRRPPQPDAVLYHLFDPRSGDHFMTTSLNSARAKEADGYDLSTEGRVFSSQVKGTVAISLDSARSFVYRDLQSVPRNTSVTALYRLETAGDFFYTASSSVANQAQAQGWARSTPGYIAT